MIRRFIRQIGFDDQARLVRLGKESVWIIIGQVASVLGAFALVRVLTEHLHPAEYGDLALGLTIAGLVNQVAMGGIASGISRFYSIAVEKNDLGSYLRASWRMMGYATIAVICIATVLMVGLMATSAVKWMILATVVTIFSILSGYSNTISGVQNAARQRAVVALHSGLDAWLKLGLSVAVIWWLGNTSTAVVIGYVISIFLILISQSFFFARLCQRDATRNRHNENDWMRQMWVFSWPLVAGGLFNWGYFSSQRWALEMFTSTEAVGKLYALMQVSFVPINLLGGLIMSLAVPILYARIGDPESADNRIKIKKSLNTVYVLLALGSLAVIVATVGSFMLSKQVFQLVVAKGYHDVSPYMPWVVAAAGMLQLSYFMASILSGLNKTALFFPLATIGNGTIILLNFVMTWAWGFEGLIVSQIFGAALHLTWMTGLIITLNKRAVNE